MKPLKINTVKMIPLIEWNRFVSEVYGRPYHFQQQDGCISQGTFELTVPKLLLPTAMLKTAGVLPDNGKMVDLVPS